MYLVQVKAQFTWEPDETTLNVRGPRRYNLRLVIDSRCHGGLDLDEGPSPQRSRPLSQLDSQKYRLTHWGRPLVQREKNSHANYDKTPIMHPTNLPRSSGPSSLGGLSALEFLIK
ncbi:UNVERIFIED_CONTAM: hypothetical protein Slati_2665800 [Sesamum latifolium]|uniref:Uncharacterized protein n=1 Tax=Sesamum latifolium TaxID=2727402 RepID=A0AAW2VV22_9LAMI